MRDPHIDMRMIARGLIAGAVFFAGLGLCHAQVWAWDDGSVPFVVTPEEVVDRMLRIADVGPGDYVIDLGSGDGRIVIGAAMRGARALGIDIDPTLVAQGRENARAAGVTAQTAFAVQDMFETRLDDASVVTMYLLPEFNLKLRPKLLKLKPGTRLVSHDWNMGEWEPDETIELRTPEKAVGLGGKSKVHLWIIPADARGGWVAELPQHGGRWQFQIRQDFQSVSVDTFVGASAAKELTTRGARLRGLEIKLVVTGVVGGRAWHHLFKGKIEGDRIVGEVLVSDGQQQRVIPWTAARKN